ncbi:MAG: D-sedoheptulose 7-phosphate isomerase [bacterium]|jgi:D-sedoheptulose 7-phosphate isomerase
MKKHASSLSETEQDISAQFEESAALVSRVGREEAGAIHKMAEIVIESLRNGGALLVCGNGGSAADAQHIAGELVGRFLKEREALRCIALSTDTSVLTAIGNDYGYDEVFARQVAAHGKEGDVLLAISTSGNSPNVLKAVERAKQLKMKMIALSGKGGGGLADAADICVTVPSGISPRIQEVHGTIGHILCGLVEKALCGE